MSNENNPFKDNKLISFAMKELADMFQSIQKGKIPEMSPKLKELQEELSKAKSNMTEEEMKAWSENLMNRIDGEKKDE